MLVLDLRGWGSAAGTLHAAEEALAARELLSDPSLHAARGDGHPLAVIVLGTRERAAAVLPVGTVLVQPGGAESVQPGDADPATSPDPAPALALAPGAASAPSTPATTPIDEGGAR